MLFNILIIVSYIYIHYKIYFAIS